MLYSRPTEIPHVHQAVEGRPRRIAKVRSNRWRETPERRSPRPTLIFFRIPVCIRALQVCGVSMILTRDIILHEIASGRIVIEPFTADQIGTASIDLHLGDEIRVM